MANILDNIRNYLRRPTQTQLRTLARAVASKRGCRFRLCSSSSPIPRQKGHCRLASR